MYSHQNIMSINNNVFLKCMINVTYSYSPVVFNTTVNARILDESHISFNDIIDTLSKQIPLNNFAISYCEYDNNTETFVNCGKYPLENDILIGYNPSPIVPTYIRIKLRQIIKKENVLRMDVNEEDFENIDESKQHISSEQAIQEIREYLYDMPDTYNVDNFKARIDLRMGKITVDEYRKIIGLD